MNRLSIPIRLVILSAILIGVMIGATGYLSRKHWEESDARIDETRRIAVLKSANAASRAFGDLKYWLTDASLSLLLRSQRKAEQARKRFEAELKKLKPYAPRAIAEISYELRSVLGHAAKAVDAYTSNQRVLGNSLTAKMQVSIRAINDRLTRVVNRLEAEAVAKNKASVQETRRAVVVSFSVVLLATLFGIVLTAFVLSSVQTSLVERDRQTAQRQEAEKALSHSDARLNSIVENSPAVIVLTDAEGRYVHVNRRFEELYGLERRAVLGKTVSQVFPKNEAKPAAAHNEQVVAERRAVEREVTVRHPDGDRILVTVKFPILDKSDDLIAIGTIEHDITGRTLAEQDAYGAREEAELANRAKSEFLAAMSHELRTPLNAVIGFSSAIESEVAGPIKPVRYRQYAKDIHASGEHLLNLINDILDLSKIEAGKHELSEEAIDLRGLFAEALAIVKHRAVAAKVELINDLPTDFPPLWADRRSVKQVLLNLLTNAIKFTPEAGKVTVRATLDEIGGIRFAVIDTGIGIKKQDIAQILEPFGQVESAMSRKHDGTGLGLTLSKKLVRLHGGDLILDSKPGKGTVVEIHMPPRRTLDEMAGGATSARRTR